MNKPTAMIINETKKNLITICNESKLSPVILDLIVQGIYYEIHSLAEKQCLEEERIYIDMINNKDIKDSDSRLEGDSNE